ncbi:MAG: AMP-binding protein [Clostridiales bacterium]|nr:AMP-binding protein [Clostridiales bacterium]
MKEFYKNFCKEGFDDKGILNHFEFAHDDNFNFSYDVIDEIAKREPNRRALVWCNVEGDERQFTYGELSQYSNKAANLLLSQGVKKGDKVMIILKRHYQFWFIILALHKIGAIGIPGTNLLTGKDLEYRFEMASVKHVISTAYGEVTDHVEDAMKTYKAITSKIIVNGERDGWTSFDKELDSYSDEFERMPTKASDDMLLYFTSGTTGYPKMVVHDFSYPIAHIVTAKHWQNVAHDGLHLTISETGWAKSVWGKLYGQMLLGAAVFVYDFDRFVPADMLSVIEKYKVTSFCAPPTMYRFFIKEGLADYDLSNLKYSTIAGEALNPEVYNRWYEYTGLKLMEAFGQTETTVLVGNFTGMEPKPGSMGKPSPLYDVDIVDEDGNTVPAGEVGEIVIRTSSREQPGMFGGYYLNEELTNKMWHDGLYHTGDTAWYDEDGYYWYVGRTDDLIKASGYRIGPFEIESVLIEHPAVIECAVTGAPDPIRGQVVKATIVLAQGYTASDELAKEIQNHVKEATAPYKYPRIVEFVDELPKTISGKIRRVEIRGEDK